MSLKSLFDTGFLKVVFESDFLPICTKRTEDRSQVVYQVSFTVGILVRYTPSPKFFSRPIYVNFQTNIN